MHKKLDAEAIVFFRFKKLISTENGFERPRCSDCRFFGHWLVEDTAINEEIRADLTICRNHTTEPLLVFTLDEENELSYSFSNSSPFELILIKNKINYE